MDMKIYGKIAERGVITEREIILIKNRMNRGVYGDDIFRYGPLKITPEQTKKGFDWLWDLYKSPTGKIRKHNPFRSYEIGILQDFDRFELNYFSDCGNGFVAWYMPVYRVYSKHGRYFDYVVRHVDKYTNIFIYR